MSGLIKKEKKRTECTENAAGKGPAELSDNDLEQIVGGVNIDSASSDKLTTESSKTFRVLKAIESLELQSNVEVTGNKTYEVLNEIGKISKLNGSREG